MARAAALKRRAFFVDERALKRARKYLKAGTDAEVVREAVARIAEMEQFWQFMRTTRGALRRGSMKAP